MTARAAYLRRTPNAVRDAMDWTAGVLAARPGSRSTRRSARSARRGRRGSRRPAAATRAEQFAAAICDLPGCAVLNDVVLNQVLFRFEDDETTHAAPRAVQESGEAWMGGTMWDGRAAIRISVSNWRTTEADIERTVAAFETALVAV